MPKCVRVPPHPDFFILEYMHGLSVNGQSSCEGEKSELVRGLLEGRGSREETSESTQQGSAADGFWGF